MFHRHCCARAFGQYIPPEDVQQAGAQLQRVEPGYHAGLDAEALRGLLEGVASSMAKQNLVTFTTAIDRLAQFTKSKF